MKNLLIVIATAGLLTACGSNSPPQCDATEAVNFLKDEAKSSRLQPVLDSARSSLASLKQNIATADSRSQQSISEAESNLRRRQQDAQSQSDKETQKLQSDIDKKRTYLDRLERDVRKAQRWFDTAEKKLDSLKAEFAEAEKKLDVGLVPLAAALKEFGMPEEQITDLIADTKEGTKGSILRMLDYRFVVEVLYPLAIASKVTTEESYTRFNNTDPLVEKFKQIKKDLNKIKSQIRNAKRNVASDTAYNNAKFSLGRKTENLQKTQQEIQSLLDQQADIASNTANRIQSIANDLPAEKRAIINRAEQLNGEYKAEARRQENRISYFEKGKFAVGGVRTMGINEAIKTSECVAELRFASKGNDTLRGDIRYTLQRTSDGEIYIEANLPQMF